MPMLPARAQNVIRRHAGLLIAVVVAVTLVAGHYRARHPGGRGFTISALPGFDAYVYVAMAGHPRVFTVAPWGFRVLTPWLAHLVFPEKPLRGFKWVTLVATTLAAVLLFLFLKRIGFGSLAALAGIALFCLSPPVGELLANPFSTEGPGAALEIAVLLAVAAEAPALAVIVLLALGLTAKDLFLLLVPLLFVVFRRDLSRTRAALATLAVGLGALAFPLVLRLYWAPQIHTPRPLLDARLLTLLWHDARLSGVGVLLTSLLAGLLPLAALGALRRSARPFLRRHAYLLLATLALPFLAWLNVPDERPFGFFGDVPRLHIYALPLVIPLALLALGRLLPLFDLGAVAAAPASRRRSLTVLLASALVCVLAFPFLAADRYRRYPLHARREGLQILNTCRHTLLAADRLERGDAVVLPADPAGSSSPDETSAHRWYLGDGWEDDTYLARDALALTTPRAILLLPCWTPEDLEVRFRVHAARSVRLGVEVNGQSLAAVVVDAPPEERTVRVPAALLFRGDNALTLSRDAEGAPVVFEGVSLSPVRPAAPAR